MICVFVASHDVAAFHDQHIKCDEIAGKGFSLHTKSELGKSVPMAWVGSPAQSQMSLSLEYKNLVFSTELIM